MPNHWVHKYAVQQAYGGAEEGGWWYDQMTAIARDDEAYMEPIPFNEEEAAYAKCRELHKIEYERRDALSTNYTSVLSYREDFYCYEILDSAQAPAYIPAQRPHYE